MIKRKEIIIVAVLILISLAIIGAHIFISNTKNAKTVRITQNNQVIMNLPLDKDTEKTINNEEGYNIVVIKDKKVYVREADCKNQICVNTKAIANVGESVVCLPHHLIIEIVPEGEN